MPRTAAFAVENQFSKGILTEFTGLNFPEQACTDALNVVFDNKGAVLRRTGLDIEAPNTFSQAFPADMGEPGTLAYNTFVWKAAGSVASTSFVVCQVGFYVFFYKIGADALVTANKSPVFSVRLANFTAPGAPGNFWSYRCNFSQGGGNLFITHPFCEPCVVGYNAATGAFTATVQSLLIRDFRGVEDGLGGNNIQVRPATLTNEHKYNLYNQGWYTSTYGPFIGSGNVLDIWHRFIQAIYPSNVDIWWLYKFAQDGQPPTFNPGLVTTIEPGNSPAPKGHYIGNPFYLDRSGLSGVPGIPVETSGAFRPSCSAFFAGRAFWSGVNFGDYGNQIYFSQIVLNGTDYSKCYQRNDPTSDQQTDLLSNDGGVIKILEAARIVALVPIQSSLLVIATNGVWNITGSQGIGFTATDYSVSKISGIGTNYANSVTDAAGTPMFWNEDGIYVIQQNQIGDFTVQSATETTIKSLYQDLAKEALPTVTGAFSLGNREVLWMWDTLSSTEFLQFRVGNNSFSRWTVDKVTHPTNLHTIRPMAICALDGFAESQFDDIVTAEDGSNVFASTGTVTTVATGITPLSSSFKILTQLYLYPAFGFLDFNSRGFQDFVTFTGNAGFPKNYDSYFVSGYKIRGDAFRKFQMNYVQFFTDLTEFPNGSCYVSALWDYAERYSNNQQIYPTRPGQQTTGNTRKQIRGTGEAVQFRFESDDEKPFHVIGWSEYVTGNQMV